MRPSGGAHQAAWRFTGAPRSIGNTQVEHKEGATVQGTSDRCVPAQAVHQCAPSFAAGAGTADNTSRKQLARQGVTITHTPTSSCPPHLAVEQHHGVIQQVCHLTGGALLAFVRLQRLTQLTRLLTHLQGHSSMRQSYAAAVVCTELCGCCCLQRGCIGSTLPDHTQIATLQRLQSCKQLFMFQCQALIPSAT